MGRRRSGGQPSMKEGLTVRSLQAHTDSPRMRRFALAGARPPAAASVRLKREQEEMHEGQDQESRQADL